MKIEVWPPSPPLCTRLRPGASASTSGSERSWRWSISEASITVMALATWSTGVAMRVAVTTTLSGGTVRSFSLCARAGIARASKAALDKRAIFNMASPDGSGSRRGRCTLEINHGTRRLRSCRHDGSPRNSRHTPAENWTTAPGRFPGFRVDTFCPPSRSKADQWYFGRKLTGYSCGGSRGPTPRSLNLVPNEAFAPSRARFQPRPQMWNSGAQSRRAAATGAPGFTLVSRAFRDEDENHAATNRRRRAQFRRRNHGRENQFLRLGRRSLGGAFLAPQGFYAGLHHRIGRGRQAEAGIRQARRQGDRPVGRSRRQSRQMVQGHRRDPGHGAQLSHDR